MTLGDVATCITSAPPATWGPGALEGLTADYPDVAGLTLDATTKYNPTPGQDASRAKLWAWSEFWSWLSPH